MADFPARLRARLVKFPVRIGYDRLNHRHIDRRDDLSGLKKSFAPDSHGQNAVPAIQIQPLWRVWQQTQSQP